MGFSKETQFLFFAIMISAIFNMITSCRMSQLAAEMVIEQCAPKPNPEAER